MNDNLHVETDFKIVLRYKSQPMYITHQSSGLGNLTSQSMMAWSLEKYLISFFTNLKYCTITFQP